MHKRNKLKDIQMFFHRLFHRKIVIVGAVIVFAFIFAAIFADIIAPYSPYKIDLPCGVLQPTIGWVPMKTAGMYSAAFCLAHVLPC